MNLRDELEQFMNSQLEQRPEVVRAQERALTGAGAADLKEALLLVSTVVGVYREAILRLAEEVDQLRPS